MTSETIDLDSRRFPMRVAASRLDAIESQAIFKVMLETLARPGTVMTLPREVMNRLPSVLAPLVVLADVETRVHVADTRDFTWRDAVLAATGAVASDVEDADLITVPADASTRFASILASASPGTALAPEAGTRLVLGVSDIRRSGAGSRSGTHIVLSGPGVDGETSLCIDGIDEPTVDEWQRVNSRFPAGVDVWLTTDDGRITAIPRSTRIEARASWPDQVNSGGNQ